MIMNAGQEIFWQPCSDDSPRVFGDPEKRDRLVLSIAPRLD
jgi:hypothetical protein